MMKTLTDFDLQTFMDQHEISGEIIHLEVPTPTVETAAQAVGAVPGQIVKSVLFLIRENPILAVACGLGRVDRRAIAARFGVGRKRVKLANAQTVLEITGYLAGAVPPFGHHRPVQTLLDRCIMQHDLVFAGGGSINALVKLPPSEIARVTKGEWVELLESLD